MKTQFLTLKDGTIAYDDCGSGPLVVCLPAGGDLRSEYRFLTPQLLAAGYRVVTMDLRGQGESSAKWPHYSPASVGSDILALIRHLNAGPAVVIGTSAATAAAIWASVEVSDLVQALVLISGSARAASPLQSYAMAYFFLSPLWGRPLYNAYFPMMYPSTRPADFEVHRSHVNEMLKEPGRLGALREMFATAYRDWDTRVSQVKVPVLVMMGSRDPDFKNPEQEGQTLGARLQSAQVTVKIIEGAGHHLQAEMPDDTGRSIISFLAAHHI
jgi:pimeloyl-ACP methyl ester carboxylesterase